VHRAILFGEEAVTPVLPRLIRWLPSSHRVICEGLQLRSEIEHGARRELPHLPHSEANLRKEREKETVSSPENRLNLKKVKRHHRGALGRRLQHRGGGGSELPVSLATRSASSRDRLAPKDGGNRRG